MDWDEHLPTILFSYRITYKVAIGYTPYQLVYGLHLLMPIEYIPLVIGNDHIKGNLVKVLTSKVLELKKLQEDRLQSKVKSRTQQWNMVLWNQRKNTKKWFKFGDFVLWFLKGSTSHFKKLLRFFFYFS
jgi:hypothetical protein